MLDVPSPSSIFISAPDGLRLHARCHGKSATRLLPVACLPGLARTAEDFDALAGVLASKHGRRVIALDYRGRGLSDYDRDPANYSFQTELADVLAALTALDALPAIFVGTSRGGILTMLLAAMRPTAIAGCVLNDIGPVIDPKGLMRIKGYVGKLPQPRTYEEGAEILRRLFDAQFPKLSGEAEDVLVLKPDAEAYYQHVMRDRDARRICGFTPIYLLTALMEAEGRAGELLRYTQWIDTDQSSSVTFAAAVFTSS